MTTSTFRILPWADCTPKGGTPGELVLFHGKAAIDSDYFSRVGAPTTTTVTIGVREYPTGRLRKVDAAECKIVVTGALWGQQAFWRGQAQLLEKLMARLNDRSLDISKLPLSIGAGAKGWLKLKAIVEECEQND